MEALLFQSDSDCPGPEAVQAEVRDLTTPAQRSAVPADARVVIADRGDHIAVALTRDGKTTVRVYQDAARDCDRRAHFVSVLAVVSLMPAELASDAEPAAPPAVPTREPEPPRVVSEPATAPTRARTVRLELGAVADFSVPVADTVRAVSPGASLGVALGAGSLRLTLLTQYAPSVRVDFTGDSAGSAELAHLDASVGARYVLSHRGVDSSIEVGALASRAEVSGLVARRPSRDTAFSVGGRAGLHVGFGEQRLLSPFLSAHARLFPFAPALSQLPQGTVGHLPYLWLGVSAGLALSL